MYSNGAGKTCLRSAPSVNNMAGRDAEYATMKDIIDLVKNCWSNGTSGFGNRAVRQTRTWSSELDKGYGSD